MNIDLIGSFSLILFAVWIGLSQLARLAYPRLRKKIFALEPSYASSLLLAWICAPFLLSLALSILLFAPFAESILVADHCHGECGAHLPISDSVWLVWAGFFLLLVAAACAGLKSLQQYLAVRRLAKNLQALGEHRADYVLLQQDEPLVFTLGWWRGRVYISQGLMNRCSDKELDIIFAHEEGHAQRKDNLRSLAARLALLALANRYGRALHDDFQVLTESACDFMAAKKHGSLSVAESLVKVHRLVSESAALPRGVSAFAGSSTELRVRALLAGPGQRPSASSVFWVALALVFLLLGSIHPLHHLSELLVVG